MADLLANMKAKLRCYSAAYSFVNELLDLDSYAPMCVKEAAVHMNLTDCESINRIREIMQKTVNLKSAFRKKDNDNVWYTVDEWTETLCWNLIKQPRINAAKWRYWFTNIFDILDDERDGFLTKEQFNFHYLNTRLKNDKEFLDHAFSSIDTSKAGKVSKQQYVDAYMKYMTDPDTTYDQFPLF